MVDHSAVQAWAKQLDSDHPLPPRAGDNEPALDRRGRADIVRMPVSAADRKIEVIWAELPVHIEEVRTLFLEYANSLGFSLCFQSFDDELKNLPGAYGPPDGRLLLARYGGHAAGCIAFRKLEPGICEMKRLYVRPDYRGHGLGRMLVESLIGEARGLGYGRMRLDTVESAMKDAIALYRRMGFKEIEPYSTIPVASALWMELLL